MTTVADARPSGYVTSIERFSLYADQCSVHYERDADLTVNTKDASRGGDVAGLLLVELGIDGYQTHAVRLDFGVGGDESDPFRYDRRCDEVRALSDAIEALTAVRDRLATVAGANL